MWLAQSAVICLAHLGQTPHECMQFGARLRTTKHELRCAHADVNNRMTSYVRLHAYVELRMTA